MAARRGDSADAHPACSSKMEHESFVLEQAGCAGASKMNPESSAPATTTGAPTQPVAPDHFPEDSVAHVHPAYSSKRDPTSSAPPTITPAFDARAVLFGRPLTGCAGASKKDP